MQVVQHNRMATGSNIPLPLVLATAAITVVTTVTVFLFLHHDGENDNTIVVDGEASPTGMFSSGACTVYFKKTINRDGRNRKRVMAATKTMTTAAVPLIISRNINCVTTVKDFMCGLRDL